MTPIKRSFIFLLLAIGIAAEAQTVPPVDQTLTKLEEQAKAAPLEKVYLQLDKPYYSAGDTLWFKAYDVIGSRHRLSAWSNVLNVELINQHSNIIRSAKLYLSDGMAYGDFALPDTLSEGNYRIRAYTNWMRNAGYEYFFDQNVVVVNSLINKVFTNVNYTYNADGKTVEAEVNYTDLDGNPLEGKPVKYEVQLHRQKNIRGEGVTDTKGNLYIKFTDAGTNLSNSGELITSIKLDNRVTVTKTNIIKATSGKATVRFFPEGGNLVTGVPSVVAFKATAADGLGVGVKGMVVDDAGNEIISLASAHLGMGQFILNPQSGKTYKANITYANGSQATVDLPKAADKGYVLTIDNHTDPLNLIVKITGDTTQTGLVTLVAQSGGEVFLHGKGKPGRSSFTATIPKSKLPQGIAKFTLFADSGEPLNERMVFIQNPERLKLQVTSEKQAYLPRQKVKLNLEALDKDNKPIQGNFSVSIINETEAPADEIAANNIMAGLLLSGDLTDFVEQPDYYFNENTAQSAADLDVLMLTEAYHRFEWKQVSNKSLTAPAYEPEKAIVISGRVTTPSGKAIQKGKVTLMSSSSIFFAADTLTDKNGRFAFNIDFIDSLKFSVRAADAYGNSEVLVKLDDDTPAPGNNKNAADMQVNINKGVLTYLRNSKKYYDDDVKSGKRSIVLREVNINTTVKAKTPKQLALAQAIEYSANLNGKGAADQIVTYEAFEGKGCPRIIDCLAGVLVGVIFDPRSGTAFLFSSPINPETLKRWPMIVILDGIMIDDISVIRDIDNISSIEVLRSGYYTAIYGSRGGGGVLVITSKHGNITASQNQDKGTLAFQPRGFFKPQEFYAPKYESTLPDTGKPDLRTTVAWNPTVKTDENGKASLEYFNSDLKGTYRVTIEGMDYEGNLSRQVYRYKVE